MRSARAPLPTPGPNVADHAAAAASQALRATQRAADEAFDRLDDGVESARGRTSPWIDLWSRRAETAARRSADAARRSADAMRDSAYRASDATSGYVRDEPLKALLIAAAAGAAFVALVQLLRGDDR